MKRIVSLIIAIMLTACVASGCTETEKETPAASDSDTVEAAGSKATPTEPYKESESEGLELYNKIFDLQNRVTVSIDISDAEIEKLQQDFQKYSENDENRKSEIYRKADVTFTVGDDSYTIEEVGIRLKGNQSLEPFYDEDGTPNICNYKLSFDETFDKTDDYGDDIRQWTEAERSARKKRTFATLNEIDIKWNIVYDDSNIREIYAAQLFETADQLTQKIGLSQLIVNGNNYGLVKIYEPVDETFLEKRLPKSAQGGDLYKCMWSECDNEGNRTGHWRGANYDTDNSYGIQKNSEGIKFNFNLKTNKKTSDNSTLVNFLNVVNKPDITKEELEKVLDVDSYAKFMAAEYFAGDPDDIRNNYNNHYIYFRKDDGKAIFIVYDNDRTMGITYGLNKNCAEYDPFASFAVGSMEQQNPLIANTVTKDALPSLTYVRDKYAAELETLSKSELLTSDAEFNKMYETVKANYEDIITPYIEFANQNKDFTFSLDGNENGSKKSNMSFEQFRSKIMETYEASKQ